MPLRAQRLQFKGNVENRGAAMELIPKAGDAVLVERGRPRWLVMRCPDGCGEELAINLDKRVGPAWRLYKSASKVSVYPSVWRDSGCGSHFIVWNNSILWCGWEQDDLAFDQTQDLRADLSQRIISAMERHHLFMHFVELADMFDELPWLVLMNCRALVREGILEEGRGENKGKFLLKKQDQDLRGTGLISC